MGVEDLNSTLVEDVVSGDIKEDLVKAADKRGIGHLVLDRYDAYGGHLTVSVVAPPAHESELNPNIVA